MEKKSNLTRLIVVALLLALEIILTRFCSINTPIVRIGFGFLPIAMIAILYGPWWSSGVYAIGDFIGAVFMPTGPYFPGFTLTAFLTGFVFGIVLYKKPVTWKRVFFASVIVVLGLNLCLDTYWLQILLGQSYIALLPARIIKCAFAIPVQVLLIPLVWDRVLSRTTLIGPQPL